MMYQSDGLPDEQENKAKPFLDEYAENIISDYVKRTPRVGDYALRGMPDPTVGGPDRIDNYV